MTIHHERFERWTAEEKDRLAADWADVSILRDDLPARFGRTMAAIAQQAIYMKLGKRPETIAKRAAKPPPKKRRDVPKAGGEAAIAEANAQAERIRRYYAARGEAVRVEVVRVEIGKNVEPVYSPRIVSALRVTP